MIKGLVKIDDTLVICVDEICYFFENAEPSKADYSCEITFKNSSKIWTTSTVSEVWEAINSDGYTTKHTPNRKMPEEVEE